MTRAFKRDPKRADFFSLGADGVLRVYQFPSFVAIDAVRLSTAQIKEYLDRRPFDQATEDKFRGVNGYGVAESAGRESSDTPVG